MNVIQAPSIFPLRGYLKEYTVFLAGGITNCKDWQAETITAINDSLTYFDTRNVSIMNPRRDKWPDNSDLDEVYKQIEWEHKGIMKCDIFSIYFCNSKSVQPICLFELGKALELLRCSDSRIENVIVSVESGYEREKDVEIQCALLGVSIFKDATPSTHGKLIANALNRLGVNKKGYKTDEQAD